MKTSSSTPCPYCKDSVKDLEEHLRKCFAPKDPNTPLMKRHDRTGIWYPIDAKIPEEQDASEKTSS